jgi:branched-chain amino acid transport system ATP-binding protein
VLTLKNLYAGYGATTVLRDVNLVVPDGSVVALLGSNGAGKTTLLRAACGLISPTSGKVIVDGEDLTGHRPNVMQAAGVCHIPEGRGVFKNLTVKDNLELQAAPAEKAAAVERAVSAFPKLGQRMSQLAGTMSGGEQQMLALARSYTQHPKTVLLDEVSMGLAPKIVDEIFEFLGLLASQGTSLLLVEQYVTRALALADYVYVLNRGRISFAGDSSELDQGAVFEQYLGTATH